VIVRAKERRIRRPVEKVVKGLSPSKMHCSKFGESSRLNCSGPGAERKANLSDDQRSTAVGRDKLSA
jgi:hypothetical protein